MKDTLSTLQKKAREEFDKKFGNLFYPKGSWGYGDEIRALLDSQIEEAYEAGKHDGLNLNNRIQGVTLEVLSSKEK